MNNLNGIFLVIASMAGFTLEDMFVKQLSTTLPVGQIMVVLGFSGAVIFAIMARIKGRNLLARNAWSRTLLVRALFEAIAALAFVTSLALVPLSTVASVFQATPLAITMGAALFFGEQVGWRRWSAIIVGFIGVLLIIRPGYTSFDPKVFFVLIAVLAVAMRDLITRLIDENVASTVISCQGFAAFMLAGAILLLLTPETLTPVSAREAGYFIGGIIFGVAGYYAIVAAMRVGDASAITPFRYSRLLFSLIVGVVVFHEHPDTATLTGATIIIASGLYTFLRERRLARAITS
ncbi:MAG: DMT family transporter [Rhodobacterales bacterium]